MSRTRRTEETRAKMAAAKRKGAVDRETVSFRMEPSLLRQMAARAATGGMTKTEAWEAAAKAWLGVAKSA